MIEPDDRDARAESEHTRSRQVVVVGAGFAGFFAARRLARLHPRDVTVTMVSDTDSLLYQPLLPEVAVGTLDPRTVAVPLTTTLRRARIIRGFATSVNADARTVIVTDEAGQERTLHYDRLVLTPGGVTRLLDIQGLAKHALGFKTIAEALYLRDLVLRRLVACHAALVG